MPDLHVARPPAATGDERWEALIRELEGRLSQWQAAVEGGGPYPDDFVWPEDLGPCPAHLAGRARRVHAAQDDLRARLAGRREALAGLLRTDDRAGRAVTAPLFVDQRS